MSDPSFPCRGGHMLVEGLFWFHPLVWWIGARLIDERERACDEEVLRLGSEPEVYVAGIVNPAPGRSQAQTTPLRFEVATIKPANGGGSRGGLNTLPGGGLRMSGATLKGLLSLAYDLRESQISGGPAWTSSEAYDVNAKLERPETGAGSNNPAPGMPSWKRLQQRLQSLLEPSKSGDDVPPGTMRSRSQITGRAGTITC